MFAPSLGKVLLCRVRLLRGGTHDGDVVESLTVLVEPLLVDAGPVEWLEELDHDRPDVSLRADHAEVGRRAPEIRVVKRGRLVLVDVPRPPAEDAVVALERLVDVLHDDGDLADRERLGRTTPVGSAVLRFGLHAGLLDFANRAADDNVILSVQQALGTRWKRRRRSSS